MRRILSFAATAVLCATLTASTHAAEDAVEVQALVRVADRLVLFGRPREALKLLARARAVEPANERALRYSFRALRLARDWKGVLDLYDEVRPGTPAAPLALLPAEATAAVAVALERTGRLEESRRLLLDELARIGPQAPATGDGRLLVGALAAGCLARGEPELATPAFLAEWLDRATRDKAAALHARLAAACEKAKLPRAALAERRLAHALAPGGAGHAEALKRAEKAAAGAIGKPRLRWFAPEFSPIAAPVFVEYDGGAVVVFTEAFGFIRAGGRVVALDAATGRERWRREPPLLPMPRIDPKAPEYEIVTWVPSPPIVARGRVYAAFTQRRIRVRRGGNTERTGERTILYALDPRTGKLLWKREFTGAGAPQVLLAAAGGTLLVQTQGRRLAGFDAETGKVRWTGAAFPIEIDPQRLRLAISETGRVLAPRRVAKASDLAGIDGASGEARWALRGEWGSIGSTLACASKGTFFVTFARPDGRRTLAAHAAGDGVTAWRKTFVLPGSSRGSSPAVNGLDAAGGCLYVSAVNALRCLESASGKALWRRSLRPAPAGASYRLGEGLDAIGGGGALVSMSPRAPELAFFDKKGALAWRWRCAAPYWNPIGTRHVRASISKKTAAAACLGGVACLETGTLKGARGEAAVEALLKIAGADASLADAALRRARELDPANAAGAIATLARLAAKARPAPDAAAEAAIEAALLVRPRAAGAEASLKTLAKAVPAAHASARLEIAHALIVLGDEKAALGAIEDVRIKAADRQLRRRFGEVLSALRGKKGTDFLVKILGAREGANARDAHTRVLAIQIISARRNEKVRDALLAALADPEATVRAAAAPAIASNMGRAAIGPLKAARGREASPLVRSSLDRAIESLGGAVAHRPHRPPTPAPLPPRPTLTREAALDRARAKGKVLWVRDDPIDKSLAWIALEGKFLLRFDAKAGALDTFSEYLALSGKTGATARAIAFTPGHVWVATTHGAIVYDRRRRSWSPYAINLDPDLIDAPVTDVKLEKDAVVFTLEDKRCFAFDPKTKKWRKF